MVVPAIVVREQNPALHGPRQACGRLLMPEFWLFLGKERADTFSDILCLKGLIAQRQRLLDGIGFIRIEGEIQNYVTVSICLKDIVRL